MNQDNNYNFDPNTGQPINYQSQTGVGYTQQTEQVQSPKKNNKLLIIVIIFVIIGIVGGILFFANRDQKRSVKPNNNQEIEENTNNNSNVSTLEDEDVSYDKDGAFLFRIDDIFTIVDRDICTVGTVQRGKVKAGDTVQIVGFGAQTLITEVTSVERFGKTLDEAVAGEIASIFLKDILKDQIREGQVLSKQGSIGSVTKFDADVYILSTDEGGRKKPFLNGDKAQFYFGSAIVEGLINLPGGIEMAQTGKNVSFTTTLTDDVAMEVGTKFTIKENYKVVARGTVTKIY